MIIIYTICNSAGDIFLSTISSERAEKWLKKANSQHISGWRGRDFEIHTYEKPLKEHTNVWTF